VLAALAATVLVGPAVSAERAGWQRTDLIPVSQPVPVGGRLLVYVAEISRSRSGLLLVALDPTTGKTVWTTPASPSGNPPGVAPWLVGDGSVFVYLKETGKLAAVAAVDARSGRSIWSTPAAVVTSWPGLCPNDAPAVCITSGAVVARIAPIRTQGTIKTVRLSAQGPRSVAPGLYDSGTRNPERLVATHQATIAWRKPLAEIFDVPGATTDWGWRIERVAKSGLFVGTVGWNPVSDKGGTQVFDLARTMTVGFRIRDGQVAWRDVGSSYACVDLPCAAGPQPRGSTFGGGTPPRVGVRLRMTGTLTQPPNSDLVISPDAAVTIEGFDFASGRTLWTFDAGHNVDLIENTPLPQTGASTVLLPDAGGTLVRLDLETGAHRPAAEDVTAWCLGHTGYNAPNVEGKPTQYRGQLAVFACNARGRRVARPDSVPAFVGRIGTRVGRLAVWSDTNGVVAAPVASSG
jgi:outer membrane protein assembly factor BamB